MDAERARLPERAADLAPARVCLVDDDRLSLAAMAALLETECEVIVSRSGRDALRLVRRQPPDLIVLDLEMPDMDGFSVCRRLKEDPLTEDLPVVFLTAHNDDETEVRGLAAGAADFIAKPPRGPVVLARIRNLVRMKRLAEQLRAEAQTDGLTGLGNRAHFMRALRQELLRAQRQRQPVSLLMVDVDHFKLYNDHFGHLAGDGALRQVAQTLKAVTHRAGDLACRFGGEEFVILLPATDLAGAGRVALKVLEQIGQLALPHPASPTVARVSVSIGAATFVHAATEPVSAGDSQFASLAEDAPTELIARADAALYAAKRHGRNQIWHDRPTGLAWYAGGKADGSGAAGDAAT